MKQQKILVPVDYSASSKLALHYAMMFAEKFGSNVHVFNAWEVPPYLRPDLTVWSGEVSATLSDHARAEAEKGMKEFLADTGVEGRANVTNQIIGGAPYSTILTIAKEGSFDLIAMGTHGRTGVSHLLLGSVAERVVRHAPCPVLTVRAPAPGGDPHHH
jgi:nucleotide-binding universal stress UspA family protein